MNYHYQYLHFEKPTKLGGEKQQIYSCLTNRGNDELGQIKYYARWKQWCYFPTVQAVYSDGCLKDIADFLSQLNDALKGQPIIEGGKHDLEQEAK